MAFKIKDLMINLAPADPEGGQCGRQTNCALANTGVVGCARRRTLQCTCGGRQTNPTLVTCRGRQTNPEGWAPGTDPGETLEELAAIKAQLQAALLEVDEEIEEIEGTLRPKTIEEVEELQTKLKDALEELDKIKAGLSS